MNRMFERIASATSFEELDDLSCEVLASGGALPDADFHRLTVALWAKCPGDGLTARDLANADLSAVAHANYKAALKKCGEVSA